MAKDCNGAEKVREVKVEEEKEQETQGFIEDL
jgi:hypothetical protein